MSIKTEVMTKFFANFAEEYLRLSEFDESKVADTTAIQALGEIQDILKRHEYSDFEKVDAIVSVFDKYHLDVDGCHDFI